MATLAKAVLAARKWKEEEDNKLRLQAEALERQKKQKGFFSQLINNDDDDSEEETEDEDE